MKILHYINDLGSGGAEKLITDMLPLMKEKGHQPFLLISTDKNNFKRNEDVIKTSNIPYKCLGVSIYNPFQIYTIVMFIRKHKFDVVHAHLFPTQYWLAFASFFLPNKTKLVKTEHSVYNERKNYKFLKPLEKLVYSRYTSIIAITEKVKQNLSEWLHKSDNIVVIPNGINLSEMEKSISDEKSYSFLSSDFYNILMVGRFDGWQKDQLTLIKSLRFLDSNVKVFFAGKGPFMEKVKEEVELQEVKSQVVFLGIRDDIYSLMNKVDLNILSTNHEGLSGVTLESLASGKPFLGSDVEGVQEVVPSELFLFPPKSPMAIAEKIKQISANKTLRNEMISLALSHVKQYDTKNMVNKYLSDYKRIQ
ncbi:glycosyltransferase [Bizionia sp. KMM 8389]